MAAGLKKFFPIIVLLLLAVVIYHTHTHPEVREQALLDYSYYFILSLFLVFAHFFGRYGWKNRNSIVIFFRKRLAIFAAAALLVAVSFATIETHYKVLSDETNLASVSLAMHHQRTVHNFTMGKYYFGEFHSLKHAIPKRPFLYPFLASLLHTFTGYRVENLFILNLLVLFGLLALVGCVVAERLGSLFGVSAMLLVFAQPIVQLTANSAGFDLLAASFLFLCIVALLKLKASSSVEQVVAYLLLLSLLAHTRYESIVFSFLLALPVLAAPAFRSALRKYWLLFSYLPVTFLPQIWQRSMKTDAFENKGTEAFSVEFLGKHLYQYFTSQFDLSFKLPYAVPTQWVGWFFVILLGVSIYKRRRFVTFWSLSLFKGLSFGAVVLSSIVIYFSFHFGKYGHPSADRMFIFFAIGLALAPFAWMSLTQKRFSQSLVACYSLSMVLLYHPVAMRQELTDSLVINRKTKLVETVLKKYADDNTLVIVDRPGHYIIRGYSAVNFSYARKEFHRILREKKHTLFPKVLVLQDVDFSRDQVEKDQIMHREAEMVVLEEIQFRSNLKLRASYLELKAKPAKNPRQLSSPKQSK